MANFLNEEDIKNFSLLSEAEQKEIISKLQKVQKKKEQTPKTSSLGRSNRSEGDKAWS
jgi:diadenosine tetraphosphate (Ap4A) HIT family hydrolase